MYTISTSADNCPSTALIPPHTVDVLSVLQSGLSGDFVNDAMMIFGGPNDVHIQLDKLFGWDKSLTATVSADAKVKLRPALGLPPHSGDSCLQHACLAVCLCCPVTHDTH